MKQPLSDDTRVSRLTVDEGALQLMASLPDLQETGDPEPQPRRKAPAAKEAAPDGEGAKDEREAPDETGDDLESGDEQQPTEDDESTEQDTDESPTEKPESDEATPVAKIPVTIDGETRELTPAEIAAELTEAKKSGLRQADYTRKTQEVAAQRNEYASRIAQLDQALAEFTPAEPDWAALAQSDPEGYLEQRAQWDHHQRQRTAVRAEMERLAAETQRERMESARQALQQEHQKLVQAIPEWADQATMQKDLGELATFATEVRGFTKEELAGVTDHRLMLMLRDLHKAHLASQEKPKVLERVKQEVEQVKSRTPGPAVDPKSRKMSEETKRMLQLRRSGRIDDAARLLELGLD